MPLIWNSKEYRLVGNDSEWNKLDFVVARKLHVVYNEKITLDLVKKSFAIYGEIEKMETFFDYAINIQFAHVTFKDSRMAYLALIDCKQNPHHNIKAIRPADVLEQPDNPIGIATSPFYNLPDDCLLDIFQYCDINSLANLSVACKRLSQLLRDRVFSKQRKFEMVGNSSVTNSLTTVARLVECIDPESFHIKIYRSVQNFKWPSVAVDFAGSGENQLSVHVNFYRSEWLKALQPIAKLINCVCMQRSIYDKCLLYIGSAELSWPKATSLIMKGFSTKKAVPDFTSIVATMPKLETIRIQSLLFKMDLQNLFTKTLKEIYFENCSFKTDISKDQIFQLAKHVKANGTNFPLCLIFDRIQCLRQQHVAYPIQFDGYDDEPGNDDESENNDDYKHQFKEPEYISIVQESTYKEIMMVVDHELVSKYLYIEVGKLYPG